MLKKSKHTYLVTGAAGFIGAHVSKLLLGEGHCVIGIDSYNDYYDQRLKYYRINELEKNQDFKFYTGNIEKPEVLEPIFEKNQFAAIYNLAARAGVRYSIKHPKSCMDTNAIGTLNVLDLMRKYGVKKLILASTSSLYAGQKSPYREECSANTPISPYAASKKAAEIMAYTYHYLYNLDVSIVRYFTVYGPCGRPDMSIFRFIQWIKNEHPIQLFGDGSYSRDFTYIDDIALGTVLARKSLGYEIINLGGGQQSVSILEIIHRLENLLSKKAIIQYCDSHEADMSRTCADISKSKEMIGWCPQVSLDDGLKRTVDWHRENEEWVDKLHF